MFHEFMLENTTAGDLIPIFAGHEACEKNHKFGPFVRGYYIIHFCLSGKGKLLDKYGCHEIGAGQLFIIRPEEITTYVADSQTPWEYTWLAFHGAMAKLFDTDRSVYRVPLELSVELRNLAQSGVTTPSVYIALLFRLIYTLFNEAPQTADVAEKVKQYIRFNYMNDLTVANLAELFGFERSYLYRLFYRRYGTGIKEFLIKTRMEQAKSLLEKGYGVGETAFAVGYKDPFNFSKAYKERFGVSPKEERRP